MTIEITDRHLITSSTIHTRHRHHRNTVTPPRTIRRPSPNLRPIRRIQRLDLISPPTQRRHRKPIILTTNHEQQTVLRHHRPLQRLDQLNRHLIITEPPTIRLTQLHHTIQHSQPIHTTTNRPQRSNPGKHIRPPNLRKPVHPHTQTRRRQRHPSIENRTPTTDNQLPPSRIQHPQLPTPISQHNQPTRTKLEPPRLRVMHRRRKRRTNRSTPQRSRTLIHIHRRTHHTNPSPGPTPPPTPCGDTNQHRQGRTSRTEMLHN